MLSQFILTVYFFSPGCVALPAPTNGTVQTVHSVTRQLLAVFTCDEGYAAVGKTILSCVDGEWDKIPPLCACELYVYQLCTQTLQLSVLAFIFHLVFL